MTTAAADGASTAPGGLDVRGVHGGPDVPGVSGGLDVPAVRSGTVGAVAWASAGDPGSAATPVLLLHGVSDSGECWDPVVRHLASERLVVTVDARGHGRTPLGDEPFTMAALAHDAVDVLREVVGRPAVVVGHSMGALVAEEIALSEPDLVRALVLEEPGWHTPVGASVDGVPTFLAAFFASFAGVPAHALEHWSQAENPAWPDDEHAPWAHAKTQVDQRLARTPQDWGGRDWVEDLALVTCPITLISGAPERGSVVTADARARAAELLGDGLVDVQLATVGHNARREDRAGFLAALDAALDGVPDGMPGAMPDAEPARTVR